MKWFKGVKTIEELRKMYRELLKEYHPDNGGNVSDMQEINSEYDVLFKRISASYGEEKTADNQSYTYDKDEENKAFKEVLSKIININADIEIIGLWVWIHGGYEYRELLKSTGFRYAPKKKCWCWHYGEYHRHSKKEVSLDDIRIKYGSQKVKNKARQYALN